MDSGYSLHKEKYTFGFGHKMSYKEFLRYSGITIAKTSDATEKGLSKK